MWLHVPITHTKHGALMIKVSVAALQKAMDADEVTLTTATRHLVRALEQHPTAATAATAVTAAKADKYPALAALANQLLIELHFLTPPTKNKSESASASPAVVRNEAIAEARRHLTTLLRMKTTAELEAWIDARAYPSRESGVRKLVLYGLSGNKKHLAAGTSITGEHKRLYNWVQRTMLVLEVDVARRYAAVQEALEVIAEEETAAEPATTPSSMPQ